MASKTEHESRVRQASQAAAGSYAMYADDLAARDRVVLGAADDGCSFRELADWSGLSQARINQLIARAAAVG